MVSILAITYCRGVGVPIKNKKLDDDYFYETQKYVLSQWTTGRDVDFLESVSYHKLLPCYKVFSHVLNTADEQQLTLTQPRAGVALLDEHIDLLRYLEEEGEADLLSTTIDSYTRQNRYTEAQHGLEESRVHYRSLLNGFPAVNQGVSRCRKLIEHIKTPIQVRHGTPDARLLAEITIAGGFTAFEGGGISYNIPYSKNVSLEETILKWQYIDRLVGKYQEAGVTINREPFGPLTGTLVPPFVSHVVAILETLLAAEQGVKNITVGYGQCGNLIQDVAAIKTLRKLTIEYLDKFGYKDIKVTTVLHQWMGGFPQDEAKAYGVISLGAAVAALSKATKVIIKTPHEALGVPTKEANAQGIKTTKQVINMLKDQNLPTSKEVEQEEEVIIKEVNEVLSKVIELGDGDIAQGVVRSFEAGVIDIPFAPSKFNAGRILPARDITGAVRLLNSGNIPFSTDILDFHRTKIDERAKAENRAVSFEMIIDDINAVSKGMLIG